MNIFLPRRGKKKAKRILLLLIVIGCLYSISSVSAADVKICGNGNQWPPYYYYETEINGQQKLTGITSELREAVFKIIGTSHTTDLIPWKRCQHDAAMHNYYEAITEGTYNNHRLHDFYFTLPLYKTTIGVVFSTNTFPNGLLTSDTNKPPESIADLAEFKICGVLGLNYDAYYEKFGLSPDIIVDQTARSTEAALKKVARGDCDVFEMGLERFYGARKIGHLNISNDLTAIPLPKVDGATFYMMISKKSPRAEELVTAINQALIQLEHTGQKQKIVQKYLKLIDTNPPTP